MTDRTKKKTQQRGGRKPGEWKLLSKEDLIRFRSQNGFSRSRLATALGVSSTSIQNWETEHAIPTLKAQQKLVEVLKRPDLVAGVKKAASLFEGRPFVGEDSGSALFNATGQIVTAYLAKSDKISAEEVAAIIRTVRAALESK